MKIIDVIELEKLINDGSTLKEISEKLELSLSTIKRNMSKLGLKSKSSWVKNTSGICLNCDKCFTYLKSENRKFCCKSCSVIYNNKKRGNKENKNIKVKRIRIFKEKEIGICLNCNEKIIKKDGRSKAKFCNIICQTEFNMYSRVYSRKASKKTLKLFLIKKNGNKCMECGWDKINEYSNKVPIELEHIDGNSENNNLENLMLLCPNCHSLTPTYKALNKGNGRYSRMIRYKEGKSY